MQRFLLECDSWTMCEIIFCGILSKGRGIQAEAPTGCGAEGREERRQKDGEGGARGATPYMLSVLLDPCGRFPMHSTHFSALAGERGTSNEK